MYLLEVGTVLECAVGDMLYLFAYPDFLHDGIAGKLVGVDAGQLLADEYLGLVRLGVAAPVLSGVDEYITGGLVGLYLLPGSFLGVGGITLFLFS